MAQVIIIGGGLAGLSAAHTVLENGGRVVVIDKSSFLGGNSTKATSGINGAATKTQKDKKIDDTPEAFEKDTTKSARGLARPELIKVLTHESGPAVEWLQKAFKLDLSLVSRLGGHSFPRTHRGKERFPGMTITYALMERMEEICKDPNRARVITKATVTRLLTDSNGAVSGVEYTKDGKPFQEKGPVIVATGGYGADFGDDSLLKEHRPDLLYLSTTNGDHCSGDGIKISTAVGANAVDMKWVQVHPTGLVDPAEPDAKLKFLAAEALRGVGGLLLNNEGQRFCNELGHRDYVTGEMWKNKKAPFRLVLNGKASKEIEWHCKHYTGRGLMKKYNSGQELAKDMGISPKVLEDVFKAYNEAAKTNKDQYGRIYFDNLPFVMDDIFHVAIVTPVIHYCMGGLEVNAESAVVGKKGAIAGLWAAGEVAGGVHGENRLGGNSLLDCVVFGRVSGKFAAKYAAKLPKESQANTTTSTNSAVDRANNIVNQLTGTGPIETRLSVNPAQRKVFLELSWGGAGFSTAQSGVSSARPSAGPSDSSPSAPPTPGAMPIEALQPTPTTQAKALPEYTAEDVAKHDKEADCWVSINGKVLNVSTFMKEHPGGKKVILLYAGKDASEEFNMLHKPDVIEKYAPETIVGNLKGKPAVAHPTSARLPTKMMSRL